MIIWWLLCIAAGAFSIFIVGAVLYAVAVEDTLHYHREMEIGDWIRAILIIVICIAIIIFLIWYTIISAIGFSTLKFDLVAADNTVYRIKFGYMVLDTQNLSLLENINLRANITLSPDYGYHQRVERFFENTFNNLLPYKPTVEDIERICNTLDGSLLDLPNATFKLKFKNIKFVEAF